MSANERWLRVKIDSGMFSDELAVTYPATQNWQKSVFVPKDCVRKGTSADEGEVRVRIVSKEDGRHYAVLPSSQRDIVKVEESDLHAT